MPGNHSGPRLVRVSGKEAGLLSYCALLMGVLGFAIKLH